MDERFAEPLKTDMVNTWSCAINMHLFDNDPGPREVNVGTLDEPRIVDRHKHLLSVYARQLLQDVDADPARLDAVIEESRRKARHVRTLRGGWEIMQARRSSRLASNPWQALTPWERRAMSMTHKNGAEIAEAARQLVIEAGADTDDKARRSLLASIRHTLTEDVLGIAVSAETRADRARDIADEPRHIDED